VAVPTRPGSSGSRRKRTSGAPGDFGEFAYLAVTSESLDEIAEGSAGQLRFLLNVGDLISGIRGIAIEKSDLSVEVMPRETVEFIRQRHSAC